MLDRTKSLLCVYVTRRVYNEKRGEHEPKKVATCPTCGEIVDVRERFCQACQGALFNFNRWRRVGLARLVQRKFRHFFKVYVGDEIHKCQNGQQRHRCSRSAFHLFHQDTAWR